MWWRVLLWLIPLVSITDVVWAIFTKMGVTVTFGLGLYKLDSIHIAIQVALMVAISLLFIAAGPSSAQEARGGRGGEADKRARRGGR